MMFQLVKDAMVSGALPAVWLRWST